MHRNLEFTLDNTLAFLDVLLKFYKHNFYKSIYIKTTFTGDYITFNSYSSIGQKLNLNSCLTYKDIRNYFDRYLMFDLGNVKHIFKALGYPMDSIDSKIAKTKTKLDSLKFSPKM